MTYRDPDLTAENERLREQVAKLKKRKKCSWSFFRNLIKYSGKTNGYMEYPNQWSNDTIARFWMLLGGIVAMWGSGLYIAICEFVTMGAVYVLVSGCVAVLAALLLGYYPPPQQD